MPLNTVNPESKPENIPGGYPTTPKSDQIERTSTPILEHKPPQDPNSLSNKNGMGSMTENLAPEPNDVQQEINGSPANMVNNETSETQNPFLPNAISPEQQPHDLNITEKEPTPDNKENNVRREVEIPFDLNGDYNINPSPSPAENVSVGDYATGYYTSPVKMSPVKTSPRSSPVKTSSVETPPVKTSPIKMSPTEMPPTKTSPIKTSPESSTSQGEDPYHNTPTDTTVNEPEGVINVLYTSKDIGLDGDVDAGKKSDQDGNSPPKLTKKERINSKIGTLKRKIGKLIK